MRTARGQHSKRKWVEDQRRLFKDISGLQSGPDPRFHLTSFLTTGPIILFPLSSTHMPMPNNKMSPQRPGPRLIQSHQAGSWHLMSNKGTNKATEQTGDRPRKASYTWNFSGKRTVSHNSAISEINIVS